MPSDNPSSPKAQQWVLDYANYTDNLKDLAKELAAQSETIVHTEPLISKCYLVFITLGRGAGQHVKKDSKNVKRYVN